MNNDAFKHNGSDGETGTWTQLLKNLRIFDNCFEESEHLRFLRNKWVLGASEWLAGKHGSNANDKTLLGYTDDEWNFIWSTMIEDKAWAVPPIRSKDGKFLKENNSPEMFIKFIAHDLQCNIVVFDLFNNTVQICSGNILKPNNVKFDSPLLLYTTGSHFQSVVPKDHEFFVQYANELCRGIESSTEDHTFQKKCGIPTQTSQEIPLPNQQSKPPSGAERKRKSRESWSAERKQEEAKKEKNKDKKKLIELS